MRKKLSRLEQKIIRLAQKVGCEARGNVPLGKNYRHIPSWPDWCAQARRELMYRCDKKHPEKFDRLMEKLL